MLIFRCVRLMTAKTLLEDWSSVDMHILNLSVEDVRNLHKTLARMNFSNLIGVLAAEFFKVDRSEKVNVCFFLNAEGICCVCVCFFDVNCRDHEHSWGRSYWMEIQQIIRVSQAQKMGILTWHMRLFLGRKIYVYTVFSFHHTKWTYTSYK